MKPRMEGEYSEHFPAEAVDEIRSHDLDFILRFTFGILRGEVLKTARHGVWSFHHADERRYRGAPSPTLGPILTYPTNGQFLLFWARILFRRLAAAAGRLAA